MEEQSPPQWTGNFWPPTVALRAKRQASPLVFALVLLQQLKDALVVQVGVVVVHQLRVAAVVVHRVGGDALAEVGFEAVHPLVQQHPQLALVPLPGVGIGEVHQAHACLPQVPLPDASVAGLYKIAVLQSLLKNRGFLRDIGIDPHADLQAPLVELFQKALRVGEDVSIPEEARPLERLHPEAVKMEDGERDLPLEHPVDQGEDGFLVVIGGEGRREPQAIRPRRKLRRAARESGVGGEHVLRRVAREDEILHLLAGNGELRLCGRLAADLIGDAAGGVDKHD